MTWPCCLLRMQLGSGLPLRGGFWGRIDDDLARPNPCHPPHRFLTHPPGLFYQHSSPNTASLLKEAELDSLWGMILWARRPPGVGARAAACARTARAWRFSDRHSGLERHNGWVHCMPRQPGSYSVPACFAKRGSHWLEGGRCWAVGARKYHIPPIPKRLHCWI